MNKEHSQNLFEVKYIVGILLFMICSVQAFAGEEIAFLHYNLLKTFSEGSSAKFKAHKEAALGGLLRETNALCYSISENGNSKEIVAEETFKGKSNFALEEWHRASFHHYLYYDKNRMKIDDVYFYSQQGKWDILYYRILVKGSGEPLNLFVLLENDNNAIYDSMNYFVNLLKKRFIDKNIVLLGGALLPQEDPYVEYNPAIKQYLLKMDADIQLVSPLTGVKVINETTGALLWERQIDYAYLSDDLYEEGNEFFLKPYSGKFTANSLSKKLNRRLAEVSLNHPFQFALRISEEGEFYQTPAIDIISQNPKELLFTLCWDDNEKVTVEVVSMIGNMFNTRDIEYRGKQLRLTCNTETYPTGIYMLKASDSNGRTVLRRFTIY